MRRIVVINQKGGVGKTTTTANLGAALALLGNRVLLIDFDPQAHLTLHYGIDVDEEQPTAYDILTSSTPVSEVIVEARENIKLMPSDIDLAAAEAELISVMGREVVLREALTPVENDFDVMLVDCPPSLGVLTINALAACDEVLIPLQAQFFALQGLSKLLDTVMLVRQRINRNLVVGGVLLCMHESTTRLGAEVVADLTQFLEGVRGTDVPWADARLYHTRIRRNIKLAEASSFGQTAIEYAPHCNGALDYSALAKELMGDPSEVETPESAASEVDVADEPVREEEDQIVPSGLSREPGAAQKADEKPSDSSTPVRFQPQELIVPAGASSQSPDRFHARTERLAPAAFPSPPDPPEPGAAQFDTHGETPLRTAPTEPRTR
ncbi:MAG: AAA family ATPase [Planctomycetes bacterium]|nr:AAA family ATPase [Planctomycetota bacterium]